MRIGIVSQSYLPIHGGVAQHVHHQAVELRKRGHDVTIITAFFDRGDENFADGVVRIGHDVTIPLNGAFVNVTVGNRLGWQLRVIENAYHFDLVHIHGPYEPVLPLVALRSMKTPKVGTFHTYKKSSFGYFLFSRFTQSLAKHLSARITVSEAAKGFISHYFPGDYRVVPNGVDTKRFTPHGEKRYEKKPGEKLVIFVGRMDPRKGLTHLLHAFPTIAAADPSVTLLVVGGGFMSRYYRAKVGNGLKHRVKFAGYASQEDLPKYIRSADVMVAPATGFESFGIVLLEGLASGVPVVAFDNPGYKMLLSDPNSGSMLVENKNDQALAKAIVDLLADEPRRKQLAENGVRFAERFSWERVVDQLEEVYRQVLTSK